jgi:NADH-quinone oxidoreductase subunit J
MSILLVITLVITLFAAVAAMSLRNLVHSALTLAVAFSGVAAAYLQLNAEFVGFTEILVYVGAIAILIVMAVLLTRSGEAPEKTVLAPGWVAGVAVTATVFTLLGWTILASSALPNGDVPEPQISVQDIGTVLMSTYVLPLEIIALMLTVAMIGAVVIACQELADARVPRPQPAERTETVRTTPVPMPVPVVTRALEKGGAA